MYLEESRVFSNPYAHRRTRTRAGWVTALAFVAAHIPLALLMKQYGQLATLHALGVFGVGLGWAIVGRRPMRVGYLGAYVTGAEVLWRMCDARLPWEFGKYACVCFFAVALVRVPRWRLPALPLIYFALLLPSVALTLVRMPLSEAQQQISFNLSGPLALAVSAWFFAHIKLTGAQLKTMFTAMLAPLVGMACVTLYSTATATNLTFAGEASSATSGGFGPNQVSAALGLGALVACWFLLDERVKLRHKAALFGLTIFLLVQSAITFSRGGLYNAGGGIVLAALFVARDARARVRLLLVGALLLLVGAYVVVPALDDFTGGALLARFQDTSLTGRDLLIRADLQIWSEHPLIGVGPGVSATLHEEFFRDAASHTEYSRLLAEHGLLGLAAIVLLGLMVYKNFRRARTKQSMAVVALLAGWSLLFMSNVAMRMVAPSFLIGLTFAALLIEAQPDGSVERRKLG